DLQTLELARTDKRITVPIPAVDSLHFLWSKSEANVLKGFIETFDINLWHEIVNVRVITDSPHQTRRGCFALSLLADLRYPFAARSIAHSILGGIPALLFFDQGYARQIRLQCLTSRTPIQIARRNIRRSSPETWYSVRDF